MRTPEIACLLLVALFSGGRGQFQLSLVTDTPAGPTLSPGAYDPNCTDRIKNCELFDSDACVGQYELWARDSCALTCKYCTAPPTSPPPCVDVLDNCATYDHSSCSDPMYAPWAKENCRRTCRLCSAEVLALLDAQATTIPPSECVDKLDCKSYGKSACTGSFEPWARDNCMNYCGFCVGIPTTPAPCVDNIPTCSQYEPTTCTGDQYRVWAEENCRKFCNFCSGGGPTLPTTLRAPAAPTTTLSAPAILTPPPLPYLTPPPLPDKK